MKLSTVLWYCTLMLLPLGVAAQSDKTGQVILSEGMIMSDAKKPLAITVSFPEAVWNLSRFTQVEAEVSNKGTDTIRLVGYLNKDKWVDGSVRLAPNQTKVLQILLRRSRPAGDTSFKGMFGKPGGFLGEGYTLNNSKVQNLTIVREDKKPAHILIGKIVAAGVYTAPAIEEAKKDAYPLVDKWGQNVKTSWPGKITNDAQLQQAAITEQQVLNAMPGPTSFNKFGGYKNGPQLKATGRFRTEKYGGKWWLVDPEGNLFWSHGVTCVRFDNTTEVTDREHFFTDLPPNRPPWSAAYSIQKSKTVFNPFINNLIIKYGPQWQVQASENIHQRFKSWGLNSFGNWSDPAIAKQGGQTPYFMAVSPDWPKLDGRKRKFPDVFDDAFVAAVKQQVEKATVETKNDAFCVGYFIDNELQVNNLTASVMQSNAASPAKKKHSCYF